MLMYGVGPVVRLLPTTAHTWNTGWVVTWVAMLIAVHYAIPMPFIYRYMLLCRGKQLSTPIYTLLLAGSSLLAFLVTLPGYLFDSPTDRRQAKIEQLYFSGHARSLGAVDVLIYNAFLYTFFLVAAYAIVVVLTGKIWRRLQNSLAMMSLSARAREVNRQIGVVLTLQALLPFLTEVLPGTLASSSLVFHYPFRYGCYAACALYSWIAVLNPLLTMLLIRPYRLNLVRRLPGVVSKRIGSRWMGQTTMNGNGGGVTGTGGWVKGISSVSAIARG